MFHTFDYNMQKMANILIGSSNVARFYKIDKFKDFRQYNMAKCTTIESFRATISELEERVAIISIFENLIVDAAKNLDKDDSALEKAILLSINEVMALVKTTAERMPGTKIGIVTPLARPSIKWFQGKFDLMFGHIRKSIADMGATCNNVFMIDCMCTSLQQFEQDGVHLTADSGVCFIEDILGKGEKAFKAVRVDLTNNQEESSGGGDPRNNKFEDRQHGRSADKEVRFGQSDVRKDKGGARCCC